MHKQTLFKDQLTDKNSTCSWSFIMEENVAKFTDSNPLD